MLAFRPIMWFGGDSASYLATGLRLIPDPSRVGGYALLLGMLRPLHSLALVAAAQHLMGIVIGCSSTCWRAATGARRARRSRPSRCFSTRTSSSSKPMRCPTSRSAS